MSPQQFQFISKALADPQRFALLERLGQCDELACQKLVAEVSVTRATISHHMKELIYAGLVNVRREGKCAHFSVKKGVLREFTDELSRRFGLGRSRPKAMARRPTTAER